MLLLDIGLPEMDGYEVARRLRLMPALRDAVLIAHSGYGEQEHLERARRAGFDHHLVKPANLSRLGAVIALCREKRLPIE
jgi:two-component system CheB/CheR fusion protein